MISIRDKNYFDDGSGHKILDHANLAAALNGLNDYTSNVEGANPKTTNFDIVWAPSYEDCYTNSPNTYATFGTYVTEF